MSRPRALLALSLPLAAGGALLGHQLGYRLAGPPPGERAFHGYLAYAPLLFAVCLALVVAALGLRIAGRLGGRPAVWPFALVPPLAFALQETLERLAAGLSPTALIGIAVLAGLLVQLPLALAAYVVARALLATADAVGRALRRRPRLASPVPLLPAPRAARAPVRAAAAPGCLSRAPPGR